MRSPDKRQMQLMPAGRLPLHEVMFPLALQITAERIGLTPTNTSNFLKVSPSVLDRQKVTVRVRPGFPREFLDLAFREDRGLPRRFLDHVLGDRIRNPKIYRRVLIPKKSGGERAIDIPGSHLMFVQRVIHHGLLKPAYTPTAVCHSYVAGRSIASNAYAHLGVPPGVRPSEESKIAWRVPRSLLGVDLEEAYPSITDDRVFAIFQQITGDPYTAEILSCLTTWQGALPQGAPTSPLLLNFACRDIDQVLVARFPDPPFVVTRYADDFTLTSTEEEISPSDRRRFVKFIELFGFRVNAKKLAYWRARDRKLLVTGLTLNPEKRRVELRRELLERFRAILFKSALVLRPRRSELLHAWRARLDTENWTKEERRALGMIMAIRGLVKMLGRDVPHRLTSRLKFLTEPSLYADAEQMFPTPQDEGAARDVAMDDRELDVNAQLDEGAALDVFWDDHTANAESEDVRSLLQEVLGGVSGYRS